MSQNEPTPVDESTTPEVGRIENPEPVEGKPWTDQERLAELSDKNLTTVEMADRLDTTPAELVRWLTAYGIEPNYRRGIQTDYRTTDADLPLIQSGPRLEQPLSVELTAAYGLDANAHVRFTPTLANDLGTEIAIELEVGPDVTGSQSNERKLSRRNTHHSYLRYPVPVAAALGLYDGVGNGASETDRTAQVTADGQFTMRATYRHPIRPWERSGDAPHNPAAHDLEPVFRSLWATPEPQEEKSYSELTPADDFHFRLDLPAAGKRRAKHAYTDAYDLVAGDEVSLHVGVFTFEGEPELAIIVDTDPDLDDVHQSQVTTVSKRGGANGDALAMYPGMGLLDAFGIGVDNIKPTIQLVPGTELTESGTDWFAIRPAEGEVPTQGRLTEQEFLEAAEEAGSWTELADLLGYSLAWTLAFANNNDVDPGFFTEEQFHRAAEKATGWAGLGAELGHPWQSVKAWARQKDLDPGFDSDE